ncbi:MAG: ArnT family glycosyltransferase, partial [Bacteroidia bacterium]
MKKSHTHFGLSLLTVLLLLPGMFQLGLFDWDELNFAESSREMLESQQWLFNQMQFEPFWEKPPLFNWMQAAFAWALGTQDWVFRLPNLLAAVIAVNLSYHIGFSMGKRMLGSFWALSTLATFAPYFYWKSGLIDPWFNLFLVGAIWQWFQMGQAQRLGDRPHRHYTFSGLLLGLAILTKGPVALLVFALVVLVVSFSYKRWNELIHPGIFAFVFAVSLPILAWLLPLSMTLGWEFPLRFLGYQLHLAGGQFDWHNQPWFYHSLVLFFLCFPSSGLALPFLFNAKNDSRDFALWFPYMRSLFWVVLLLFSVVQTKIIHYSSLCWWPLSFFGAYSVYLWHTNRRKLPGSLYLALFLSGLGLATALIAVPLLWGFKQIPTPWLLKMDLFSASVVRYGETWSWTSLLPGFLFSLYFLYFLFRALIRKPWHPGLLYGLTAGTAVLCSWFLLKPAEKALQAPLRAEIESLSDRGVRYELWGFKSYALPFWGNWTHDDCIDSLRWNDSAFFSELEKQEQAKNSHPIQSNGFALYPSRTARNRYFQDGPCEPLMFIITRADFKP